MHSIEFMKKHLPAVLKDFHMSEFYFFSDDDVAYGVIRRTKSMIWQNWYIFERMFVNNYGFAKLYLISAEELSAKDLATIKAKALHIKAEA